MLIGLIGPAKKSELVGNLPYPSFYSQHPCSRRFEDILSLGSGLRFQLREVERERLEDSIIAANRDDSVDGIIVYYPVFHDQQDQYLQQIVDVTKDVEGLSHRYIFNMYQNIYFLDNSHIQKSILPCTLLPLSRF